MKGSFLKIVCYVAVVASFAPWPETSAFTQRPPIYMYTTQSSSTFNPKGTPCEGVICPSGKRCGVDENKQAACVCDANCYDDNYRVCGSDNKTYSSYCSLTVKACEASSNVTISYYGQCTYEGSICNGITCSPNKVCAVADKRAICVCNDNCPTYSYQVCGSDNQTYINDCYLRNRACVTNTNITMDSYGECKQTNTACDGFPCPNGTQCAINENKKAVCVCTDTCPYETNIVCGTDGRTYGSECELYREACTSATNIRVASKGYCIDGSVCSGYDRCPKNRQCNVNKNNNQPVCVCTQSCPSEYVPVCGSDGNTYQNLCQLERQACTSGTNITMERKGQCIYGEYCYGVVCPSPKYCVVDAQNQTSCVCSSNCGNYFDPYCGPDNKTYDSYCQMSAAFCEANKNITTYNYGVCSEGPNCQGTYCPYGSHCDSQTQAEPKCVCNTYCPKTNTPVCGTNNKTYDGYCELQRDACLTNTSIWTNFYGRCEDGPGCSNTYCPYGQTCALDEQKQPACVCSQYCYAGASQVCGSDGKTYSSECFLSAAACMTGKSVYVQRYEPCQKESPCDGVVCSSDKICEVNRNGKAVCVCNEKCDSYGYPVCGSDNKTYASLCLLLKKACTSSTSIRYLNYGRCVEASVCDKMSCSRDKRCVIDDQGQPTCVCIDECLRSQNPVCGSDGFTYENECELQKQACTANRNITMIHRGNCEQGTPCEGVICPSGKRCAVDENKQAACVCDVSCVDDNYRVCGSDNKTYSSYCSLTIKACQASSNVTVSYYGQCTHEGSICNGITCPPNKLCAVAGNRAICVCTQTCSTYINRVCGSDSQTYMNDCELRKHACLTNKNITINYYGECQQATACDGFSCSNGTECAIDERKKPVCVCSDTSCPHTTVTDLVCGTDGRTYGSECELYREACTSGTSIKVAYKGHCLEGSVCSGYRQCPKNKICNVNQDNQPVCVCDQTCSQEYDPVCGSDGATYPNLCFLERDACVGRINLTMVRTGLCSYGASCNGVVCPAPRYCVIDGNNQTSCVCGIYCRDDYNPVCGSDNKTYDNFCQMSVAICEANKSSTDYYNGVCSEGPNCQGISCPSGTHCDSQTQAEPKCVCNTICPKTSDPICGSNNKTYNNYCELQRENCLNDTSIRYQSNGRCDDGQGCGYTYSCPYGQRCQVDERNRPMCVCDLYCDPGSNEVCGTDGKTYSSQCILTVAACLTNKTIAMRSFGPCKKVSPCDGVVCSSDKICEVNRNGKAVCVCNEKCDSYGSPVCGSDNKTYANYCLLRKKACTSSTSIRFLNYGKCVEASACDQVSCSRDKRCAIDDQGRPTCVCNKECLYWQDPVCGSDGLNYDNECELQKQACTANRNITMTRRGKCNQGLTCSDITCPTGRVCALKDNQPICVCNTVCYSYSSVCGSDGKTYDSECSLLRAACMTDTNIKLAHNSRCTSDTTSPNPIATDRP